jgi:D-ribulokinase
MDLYLGIDFGTSGARAIALSHPQGVAVTPSDGHLAEIYQTSCPFTQAKNLPTLWRNTLFHLLDQIPKPLRSQICAIAINGTSSTVLLCDQTGEPIAEPLLYNDDRAATMLDRVRAIAPTHHTVVSATSSFAKLLWWSQQPNFSDARYFLHQADWLAFLLHGQLGISDYHNSLKLGYDVERLCYPDWLEALSFEKLLPKVVAPGTVISAIHPTVAADWNLRSDCLICAGTTDSIAAFLASGVTTPGEAVTSLGSTLVLKLLSETRIEAGQYGIYSHRLGDLWLVGGASNTGGAVLQHFFSDQELAQLSDRIPADQESLLDYYPLLKPGDRFPTNDSRLPPQMEPRPDDPVTFLHGLLESIARIEAKGYRLLQSLGANILTRVYSAGGGAKNRAWQTIRMRQLGVPVLRSPHTEAAYGTAILALKSHSSSLPPLKL